ncbi:putative lipoprotein [Treponema primitia ZAS-2]|uniref:Putative lipoprotein n=1 Tax=Treponema primitia (strain ATCC BAA-887 / DSM 12427 / ZAS-2) TaxID=545694 RepID=F5YK40_TREPZ|nr:hypothetical protein [Treponema primitia]AEF84913.1 putative lipoprotein [Treponema primitia ZAS-2]
MLKKPFGMMTVFFLFIVLSCASSSVSKNSGVNVREIESAESRFWHSIPSYDELIFIGAAGVRTNRDDSIKLALQDAARKVSIFDNVEGQFVTNNKSGAGFFDYSTDTKTSLLFNEDYQEYLENLSFDPDTDVMQYENTIFIRTRYKGSIQVKYDLSTGSNSKPSWIDNPPKEISRYTVGVGFAGRRSTYRDTVNASFEAAIFSIIREISSQVGVDSTNYHGNVTFEYRSTTENTLTARGVLKDFYVLDTWTDKSNMTVWTLAVARVSDL